MTDGATQANQTHGNSGQSCQDVILAAAHGDVDAIRHIANCDQCNAESQRLHSLAATFTEVNNLINQAEHGDTDAYQKLASDSRLSKIWQSLTSAYC